MRRLRHKKIPKHRFGISGINRRDVEPFYSRFRANWEVLASKGKEQAGLAKKLKVLYCRLFHNKRIFNKRMLDMRYLMAYISELCPSLNDEHYQTYRPDNNTSDRDNLLRTGQAVDN